MRFGVCLLGLLLLAGSCIAQPVCRRANKVVNMLLLDSVVECTFQVDAVAGDVLTIEASTDSGQLAAENLAVSYNDRVTIPDSSGQLTLATSPPKGEVIVGVSYDRCLGQQPLLVRVTRNKAKSIFVSLDQPTDCTVQQRVIAAITASAESTTDGTLAFLIIYTLLGLIVCCVACIYVTPDSAADNVKIN